MGFNLQSVIWALKYYLRYFKSYGKQQTRERKREHWNLHWNNPSWNSFQAREPEKNLVQISALVSLLLLLLLLSSLLVYCWIFGLLGTQLRQTSVVLVAFVAHLNLNLNSNERTHTLTLTTMQPSFEDNTIVVIRLSLRTSGPLPRPRHHQGVNISFRRRI